MRKGFWQTLMMKDCKIPHKDPIDAQIHSVSCLLTKSQKRSIAFFHRAKVQLPGELYKFLYLILEDIKIII